MRTLVEMKTTKQYQLMTHRHVQNNAEQLKPSYRIIILLNIKEFFF